MVQVVLLQDRFKYLLKKWHLFKICSNLVSLKRGLLRLISLVIKMKKWQQTSCSKLELWMKIQQLQMQLPHHKLRLQTQEEQILNQKLKVLLFHKYQQKNRKLREVNLRRIQISQNQIIVIMMIKRMKLVMVVMQPWEEKVVVKDLH